MNRLETYAVELIILPPIVLVQSTLNRVRNLIGYARLEELHDGWGAGVGWHILVFVFGVLKFSEYLFITSIEGTEDEDKVDVLPTICWQFRIWTYGVVWVLACLYFCSHRQGFGLFGFTVGIGLSWMVAELMDARYGLSWMVAELLHPWMSFATYVSFGLPVAMLFVIGICRVIQGIP